MSFLNELKGRNVFKVAEPTYYCQLAGHEGRCQFASTPAVLLTNQIV